MRRYPNVTRGDMVVLMVLYWACGAICGWIARSLFIVALLLAIASTAHAQDRPLNRWLLTHTVLAGSAAAVTMYGVGTGQVHEANPLTGWAQHSPVVFGAVSVGTVLATHAAVKALNKQHPKVARVVAIGLVGVAAWDVARDARTVQR